MTFRSLAIASVVLILDRMTKLWIVAELDLGERIPVLPVFDIVRWHNEGAAFSVLATAGGWQRWMFVALAVFFLGFIVWELRRLPRGNVLMLWVYGLLMGGAVGNLVDRVWQGYVVDFLLVYWHDAYFPAFNVADSALTVGAVLWGWAMYRESREQKRAALQSGGGSGR